MPKPRHLSVEDAYDRWADTYDDDDNPMVAATSLALDRLENVRRKDVVEFGCGTGRNLELLARKGAATLTGFDLSRAMLAKARNRGGDFALLHHDLSEPAPQPDASANLVVIALTLEHIEQPSPVIADAARILRPDGRLLILEIHPFLAQAGVAAHFDDEEGEVHMPTYSHTFADYLNAVSEAGLRVDTCREWSPEDFGEAATAKMVKRGAETPLLVEFDSSPV